MRAEGLQKIQQGEEQWFSLKAPFCVPFVRSCRYYLWVGGHWASRVTESKWLRVRGVHASYAHCPGSRRGGVRERSMAPACWAAREDMHLQVEYSVSHSFLLGWGRVICPAVSCIMWVSEEVTHICCCHFTFSTYFQMVCPRRSIELWLLSLSCILFKYLR